MLDIKVSIWILTTTEFTERNRNVYGFTASIPIHCHGPSDNVLPDIGLRFLNLNKGYFVTADF